MEFAPFGEQLVRICIHEPSLTVLSHEHETNILGYYEPTGQYVTKLRSEVTEWLYEHVGFDWDVLEGNGAVWLTLPPQDAFAFKMRWYDAGQG